MLLLLIFYCRCDADPQALAKYVLALIRKDKSIEELKSSMVSQMDVFLQSETDNFVEMLFKIVDTKEYIAGAQNTTVTPELNREVEKEVEREKPEPVAIAPVGEERAEADSTTPVREQDQLPEPRPSGYEDRKRRTPPRERLGHGYGGRGGGHRDHRDYQTRRFRSSRSRSRSLSPRHDRFRSTRRRSRSPPDMRRRSQERGHPPRRGRSAERGERDGGTPTRDENGAPSGYTPTHKPRCRDYDEKGFCLRGDMCKFDHGNDAVVLEDSLGYQPGPPGPGFDPYVPGIPGSGGITYPPPVMSVPPPGYAPLGVKRGYEGDAGFQPPPKRFDHGRGGSRGRGRGRGRGIGRGFNMNQSSSMLAVRNIPVEMNSIHHLNTHFSKFGTLVNVQIQFEGDPSSALITFAGTSEAAAAYNCTEAVLNNRFIKVFWHIEKQPAKERLGNANTNPNNVVLGEKPEEATSEDTEKVKEEKEKAIQEIQKSQEMLQTKHEEMKKVEEQRKEALVKQESLLKSKHVRLLLKIVFCK